MCTISIVIPVYNVEKYLSKCIDSIISQEFNDYEILLIDDGSKDSSGSLCDEYALKYKNIKVFHKENGGLSDARNYGIQHASNEYLMFVDSDDYLEKDSLSKIASKLTHYNADILIAKSFSVNGSGECSDEVKYSIKEKMYSRNEFLNVLRRNRKSIIFCAQYFICKRKLVLENNLSFKKGIIHEDELWTPLLLLAANKIYYLDSYFYYHLMRDNSIMHSDDDEKSGRSLITIANDLEKVYGKSREYIYLKDRMASFYLQAYTKIGFQKPTLFDRKIALRNAYYFNTRVKSFIFYLSPKLYFALWKRRYRK